MPPLYALAVAPSPLSRLATASSIIGFSLLWMPLWIVHAWKENAYISNLDRMHSKNVFDNYQRKKIHSSFQE
jgi:hypothetical protein